MALKALHRFDVVCNLDHVPDNASLSPPYSSPFSRGGEAGRGPWPNFVVMGHRGNGMNVLLSSDKRMKAVKENTILSFNIAGNYPGLDYIEFDVQVTKDGCPIIFHDNFIFSQDIRGTIYGTRVTELSLREFLRYGPQREPDAIGKPLLRTTKDGKIVDWSVESDDSFCTLQEAFERVKPCIGFNIELKFDDSLVYKHEYLTRVLGAVLRVVYSHAKERPIMFSTFQPDAALLVKKLQSTYPVFFLTNGGNEMYRDMRRNSLEGATRLCWEGGLQGIVSEVRGVFRNPGAVNKAKESNLSLLTYGRLNNVPEAVYMQHLMGIDGVIVDLVQEITEAVSEGEVETSSEGKERISKPKFSQRELAFLLKLIPELVQQ